MIASEAHDQANWDQFLANHTYSPFLQSWTMGNVYQDCGEQICRIIVEQDGKTMGICQASVVPARRGKHLSVPYGPVVSTPQAIPEIVEALQEHAIEHNCSFIRMSPFWPKSGTPTVAKAVQSPLHLLAEHVWYIPLQSSDQWQPDTNEVQTVQAEADILKDMRKNTRNLIRRAEKEGVEVTASTDPVTDLDQFFPLYDETRKRHKFTPYSNAFIRAQVERFAPKGQCTVYLARYQGEVLAASVHMHFGGETSYHHGASSTAHPKIPASTLLQWRAIQDSLERGDHTYSFWGIAPPASKRHPFAGVTTFKTGFGGKLLNLPHCMDIPLRPTYGATYAFETLRKWKRGF